MARGLMEYITGYINGYMGIATKDGRRSTFIESWTMDGLCKL